MTVFVLKPVDVPFDFRTSWANEDINEQENQRHGTRTRTRTRGRKVTLIKGHQHTVGSLSKKQFLTTRGTVRIHLSERFSLTAVKSVLVTSGRADVFAGPGTLFRDFSHFDLNSVDPAIALVTAKNAGLAAYDAAAPSNFRRISVTASVPNDYPVSSGYAWRRGAFLGVGARVNAMATGNSEQVDAAQAEWAPAGWATPSAYTPARASQCIIKPDRLNYLTNPAFAGAGGTPVYFRRNYITNPAFRASGAAVAVRTNYLTNPSFRASGAAVTVRTNMIPNPSFETDLSNLTTANCTIQQATTGVVV